MFWRRDQVRGQTDLLSSGSSPTYERVLAHRGMRGNAPGSRVDAGPESGRKSGWERGRRGPAGWLADQGGYSLVEVVVSIMLLSIAIIPMVGMFDTALNSATRGSNYDKARALANMKLEEVKALPFEKAGGPADSLLEKYRPLNEPSGAGTAVSCNQSPFTCSVKTRYVGTDLTTPTSGARTTLVKIDVEISWGGTTYKTSGLRTTR